MTVFDVRRALAVAAVLLAALPPAAAAPAPAARAAAKPAAGASRLAAALPDSVLARVFTGTGQGQKHDISGRQLIVAAARAGRRLESLTPKDRREFLDVLVDQAVLVARVKREPRRWEPRDSTEWNVLRDRLVLRAALDSAMVEVNFARAARGDTLLPPQELGVLLRDQAMERLSPAWNAAALEKAAGVFDTLPRPDSRMSMLEQMRVAGIKPTVGDADAALPLAEAGGDVYTLGEMVHDFGRMNPLYRPRIESAEHVKQLVSNVLFENLLRRTALERGLERRPDIAAQLAERAEYLDVSRFVAREVYAKIAMDSVTLRRHYEAAKSSFDWEARAHLVSVASPTREEAGAMAGRLAAASEAESLAARSARAGVPYRVSIHEAGDTAFFGRVRRAGAGAVLGPDSTSQGWRTVRVLEIEPRRHRTFDEAEPMVRQSWYDREGERLMRALLDGLRKRAVVVVNDKALGGAWPKPAR